MTLKRHILFIFFLFITISFVRSQDKTPTTIFRIYEDNDFLNITGNGTDNSYTAGTRFDLFYIRKKPPRFITDRLMPKAGSGSTNIFGWSLMQLMVTPNDISVSTWQPNDYSYAGALFAVRSLYSYNAIRKYSFQTELVAGVRGPASFAKETQTLVHTVINYQKPMGWHNQLSTVALVNVNFSAEKQLLAAGNFLELIGGAQLDAGSFLDAFSIYPTIRIGKMAPYFDGYLNQYGSFFRKQKKIKTQYYFIARPKATFVLYNALLHGTRMQESEINDGTTHDETARRIRHRLTDIQFGAVVARGNVSISYLQTHSTEYNKGLYRHNYGNFSLYFRW